MCYSERGWQAGSHGGIIVSCGERLSRNVSVFSQKSWRNCSSLCSTSLCSSFLDGRQDRHSSDEGHGFLSIVFTRAVKASTHSRATTSCDADAGSKLEPDDATSLNEVCLNVKPCDVLFDGSVLASLLSLFALPARQNSSEHIPHSDGATSHAGTHLPFLTSRSLPLVYVNARDFRIFIPAVEFSGESIGATVRPDRRLRPPMSGDVCVFHVGSIAIVPHAVNPLARLIIDKAMYSRALHAGITGRIGSEIEDRQYQMDISGLGVSTGCWNELIMDENSSSLLTSSENPALAWNTMSCVRYVCCFVCFHKMKLLNLLLL